MKTFTLYQILSILNASSIKQKLLNLDEPLTDNERAAIREFKSIVLEKLEEI